jgi:hypothetical protein
VVSRVTSQTMVIRVLRVNRSIKFIGLIGCIRVIRTPCAISLAGIRASKYYKPHQTYENHWRPHEI